MKDLATVRNLRPIAVVTQPDRPAGRGLKLTSPPVKEAALELGLPVQQPESVNTPEFIAWLKESGAQIALVIAFGQILSTRLLNTLEHGFFNIHLSLLPQLRGAAPVPWSIAKGLKRTGVTVFKIVRELDAGPMLCCEEVDIHPGDTAETLFTKLYEPCLRLSEKALRQLCGEYCLLEQNHERATLAPKLDSEHGLLDFRLPAWKIERVVRGFAQAPGTFAYLHSNFDPKRGYGERVMRIRFMNVSVSSHPDSKFIPGSLILVDPKDCILVQAGLGIITLDDIRPEGKRTMTSAEFVRGYHPNIGDIFLPYETEQE